MYKYIFFTPAASVSNHFYRTMHCKVKLKRAIEPNEHRLAKYKEQTEFYINGFQVEKRKAIILAVKMSPPN